MTSEQVKILRRAHDAGYSPEIAARVAFLPVSAVLPLWEEWATP